MKACVIAVLALASIASTQAGPSSMNTIGMAQAPPASPGSAMGMAATMATSPSGPSDMGTTTAMATSMSTSASSMNTRQGTAASHGSSCSSSYQACVANDGANALINTNANAITSGECQCRPTWISFTFTGGDCSTTTNTQSGKFTCSSNACGATSNSVAVQSSYGSISGGSNVTSGGVVTLYGVGGGQVGANTLFTVTLESGEAITMNIHTSCSKPLAVGDVFGPLTVRSMSACSSTAVDHSSISEIIRISAGIKDLCHCIQDTCTEWIRCIEPYPCVYDKWQCAAYPEGAALVAAGPIVTNPNEITSGNCQCRPTYIRFRMTGGGCSATTNDQDGKFTCEKCSCSPTAANSVTVSSSSGTISGSFGIGSEFTLTGPSGGKVGANTMFTVIVEGNKYSINIHTSCSKQLAVGDVFGPLTLVAMSGCNTATTTATPNPTSLASLAYLANGLESFTSPPALIACHDYVMCLEPATCAVELAQCLADPECAGILNSVIIAWGDMPCSGSSGSGSSSMDTSMGASVATSSSSSSSMATSSGLSSSPLSDPLALLPYFASDPNLLALLITYAGTNQSVLGVHRLLTCVTPPTPTPAPTPITLVSGNHTPGPVPYPDPLPEIGPDMSMTACVTQTCSTTTGYIVDHELGSNMCAGWIMDPTTQTFVFTYACISVSSLAVPSAFDGLPHQVGVVVTALQSCKCQPSLISLQYVGGSCSATSNTQSGKFTCSDSDGVIGDTVSLASPESGMLSTGTLHVGDMFTLTGANGKLDAQTDFVLSDGVATQYLSIHTSCSKPLAVGDVFGSLRVTDLGDCASPSNTIHTGSGSTMSTGSSSTMSTASGSSSTMSTGSGSSNTIATVSDNLQVTYYVDGVAVAQVIVPVSELPYTCPSGSTTSGLDFCGVVSNVVLYQDALTSSQVADIVSTTSCEYVPTVDICLSCDNPLDPRYATAGDMVTVTVTGSVPISLPSVSCNGTQVTFVASGDEFNLVYTGTLTVSQGSPIGYVSCVISQFQDENGNQGAVTTIQNEPIGGVPSTCWVFIARDCQGLVSTQNDSWCLTNCNHNPPFCPADVCLCSSLPEDAVPSLYCAALQPTVTNQWCTDNCRLNVCPADRCSCAQTTGPFPIRASTTLFPQGVPCSDTLACQRVLKVNLVQETPETIRVSYDLSGLTASSLFGFHVHSSSNFTSGCVSTGGHYNPFNQTHGAPQDLIRHVGDMGNVQTNANGTSKGEITDGLIKLYGATSVIGRAIVIHSGTDDLGMGGNSGSMTTGNAGGRMACGNIVLV